VGPSSEPPSRAWSWTWHRHGRASRGGGSWRANPPIPSVTITPRGEGLVIDYTGGRRNETQQLGTFASNPTADGGTVDVKHDVIGNRIRETYRERRGGAVHLFSLSGDGRELTLEATIRSPHLPAPISYSLVFERTR
jgi:hypothetical protein